MLSGLQTYDCRFVDKALIDEFLEHGEDIRYQKALSVIGKQMDGYITFFSELTKRQAVNWILRRNLDSQEFVFLSAYLSLLGNHRKRKELFGF